MAMDFFAAQESAKRRTVLLLVLYAVTVICITLLVYVTAEVALFLWKIWHYRRIGDGMPEFAWTLPTFAVVATIVIGTILLATLSKTRELAKGGGALVATRLGGRLASKGSLDMQEQRLVNVVEEMAVASGVPTPQVFILERQRGINAFAAGYTQRDAVIAVTRGLLQQLSRDQMQGVIAHEFSHILNGDMRLNIRLIGVLNGILFISLAGRKLLEPIDDDEDNPKNKYTFDQVAIGIALCVIGSLGSLCARLIKTFISRQQEYLADAAAVQFTRNPGGLGGALRLLAEGSSEIHHPYATEVSHLFFAPGSSFDIISTHPPLRERIRRILLIDIGPAADDKGGIPMERDADSTSTPQYLVRSEEKRPKQIQPALIQSILPIIPADITRLMLAREGAAAITLAPLLSQNETVLCAQMDAIGSDMSLTTSNRSKWVSEWLKKAGPAWRLPLVEQALQALKDLPSEMNGLPSGFHSLLIDTAEEVFNRTAKPTLSQYAFHALLRGTLQPTLLIHTPSTDPFANLARLFAMLARVGYKDEHKAQQAFQEAVRPLAISLVWPENGITVSLKALDQTLSALPSIKPGFRKTVVETCAKIILFNQRVSASEAELLRVICTTLECTVPPQAQYASAARETNAATRTAV